MQETIYFSLGEQSSDNPSLISSPGIKIAKSSPNFHGEKQMLSLDSDLKLIASSDSPPSPFENSRLSESSASLRMTTLYDRFDMKRCTQNGTNETSRFQSQVVRSQVGTMIDSKMIQVDRTEFMA